jgi:multisubunit Na+/H+ antiporter MnhG subunit
MIVKQIAVNVLLWLGVTLVLVSCPGAQVFRSVFDRLHFSAPLNLAAIFIAIAVPIQEDFSLVANKAIAIAVFLLVASSLLTHATGRAARVADRDDWRIGSDEAIEVDPQ